MITSIHLIGILLTVALLVGVSVASARGVKDARSFATGGKAGSWMVCGIILGTLVGGQSTIGTAQLAFAYGLSAWWFTLGAALGALLLGLVYAKPLRRSGQTTLMEVVRNEYGRRAETVGSALFLVGIFISITSQLLSSSALVSSLFGLSTLPALVIGAALIGVLVFFGGIRSAGSGGLVKLVLLYVSSVAAGVAVLKLGGGLTGIESDIVDVYSVPGVAEGLDDTSVEGIHNRYSNLVARDPAKDLGGCLSLALGVVCTQTYAQAIWAARSDRAARRGATLTALLIPLIGAAGTLVGLYMRAHYVTAAEAEAVAAAGSTLPEGVGVLRDSLQAFPHFLIAHMPAWVGGIALGAMLVNILGSGSGLVLGAATIVERDIVGNLCRLLHVERRMGPLTTMRLAIVVLLASAVVVASFMGGSFINDLGFLSLGLRAAALLLPLGLALWRPGSVSPRAATASMVVGTAAMLVAATMQHSVEPVYFGLAASALTVFLWPQKG